MHADDAREKAGEASCIPDERGEYGWYLLAWGVSLRTLGSMWWTSGRRWRGRGGSWNWTWLAASERWLGVRVRTLGVMSWNWRGLTGTGLGVRLERR